MTPRRPTRLEQPLPGKRCPGCWLEYHEAVDPTTVLVCARCYVPGVCVAPDRVVPFWESFASFPQAVLEQVHEHRRKLIAQASTRWRSMHPGLR